MKGRRLRNQGRNQRRNQLVRRSDLRRRLRGWIRGTASVVLGAVFTVGAVETVRWVKTDDRFAIQSIEIVGTERADADTLRRRSAIAHGTNLFEVDLASARAKVMTHPWVRDAEVRLLGMDRVVVSVVEHRPRALVALGHLYFVDRTGRIFKRYAPGEDAPLPVITGLDRAGVEADEPVQAELLGRALALIERWDEGAYGVLAEVNVDQARGLTAVVGEDGMTVALGSDDWPARLARLPEVLAALEARRLKAHRIDLAGRRRAPRAVVVVAPDRADAGDV